ncbi:hypothetical protein DYY67_1368 [Candidatus Nitrosotalea sp. TS]|nr:hypothetical protein [Candidatus Nitrosotalea sp. TS]
MRDTGIQKLPGARTPRQPVTSKPSADASITRQSPAARISNSSNANIAKRPSETSTPKLSDVNISNQPDAHVTRQSPDPDTQRKPSDTFSAPSSDKTKPSTPPQKDTVYSDAYSSKHLMLMFPRRPI